MTLVGRRLLVCFEYRYRRAPLQLVRNDDSTRCTRSLIETFIAGS